MEMRGLKYTCGILRFFGSMSQLMEMRGLKSDIR